MTSRNDGLKGPKFVRYYAFIIEALKALGGSRLGCQHGILAGGFAARSRRPHRRMEGR